MLRERDAPAPRSTPGNSAARWAVTSARASSMRAAARRRSVLRCSACSTQAVSTGSPNAAHQSATTAALPVAPCQATGASGRAIGVARGVVQPCSRLATARAIASGTAPQRFGTNRVDWPPR
jgi:hypothetical protein